MAREVPGPVGGDGITQLSPRASSVNNAAIYPIGPWHEANAAQWDADVRGSFLLARGGGAIVNLASVTFTGARHCRLLRRPQRAR